MSIIAQHAATREYFVSVETDNREESDGEGFVTYVKFYSARGTSAIRRTNTAAEFYSADEATARARANTAYVNLRNGHLPTGREIFVTRCVQCGKGATSGRPLLNGRQGLTHDSCDNYR